MSSSPATVDAHVYGGISFDEDATGEHNRMSAGRTKDCGLGSLTPNKTGLDRMDAEDSNLLQSVCKRRFTQDFY